MAQISLDNIKKIEKNRNTIHEKVHAAYTVFEMDGEKYVQIDTYGRIDRENPEKCWRREIVTIFCREYLTNFCRKSRSQQNK